ncbi:hypothetical protein [Rhizorhabdus wittichii]|uniref:hypothetical protein n=1 Tax=Rhizorhabdus wittichii TaxID=160791 RepID=UPI0002E5714E|nr:hypothetical protein [Rhizorhabdus wittichii]
MARDISKRISRLQNRRTGMDRYIALDEAARVEVLAKSMTQERWQKRASTDKSYTRYALGAMQEVGADQTRISLDTAERIGRQLEQGFAANGRSVEFRLQGSVPLNVHIRRYSDVDLLTLDQGFLTYSNLGILAQQGRYVYPTEERSVERLLKLRRDAEEILKAAYPAAVVDTSGSKAINVSGGSLARPVDVVPSHWYDTVDWQLSQQEADRAVTILDKNVPRTLDNWPFRHIQKVTERCHMTLGGTRKAIRLAKSVKCDAEVDGVTIHLPSFDIAGLMYHADQTLLVAGARYELAILAETQRWLDQLSRNRAQADALRTPDNTRAIIDSPAKFNGLVNLSKEIDDLLVEVAKEQAPWIGLNPSFDSCRNVLLNLVIAEAA